jgi:CHASE3 domain sensor protein
MKKKKSVLLFTLAIVSLIAIGGILASGIIKNRQNKNTEKIADPGVLGESITNNTSSPAQMINNLIEQTLQNAKEQIQGDITQKVTETKEVILTSVEKELSKLTTSQIETIKLQIYRDWGIVGISPTQTP